MNANISTLISDFLAAIARGEVEIYNEFSLQHELGLFLRQNLPLYKVQFERNVRFFGLTGTIKHEIDIVIYNDVERYAIELKHPLNGQHPEQMFCFAKDVKFMEELKEAGFTATFCLTLVKDPNFYRGANIGGIYQYFRSVAPLTGTIVKPTGTRSTSFTLHGSYLIHWQDCGPYKYYLLQL